MNYKPVQAHWLFLLGQYKMGLIECQMYTGGEHDSATCATYH